MARLEALPPNLVHQLCTARQLADRQRREPAEERLPTASPAFDRLLAGGLERGAMVELIGHRSSGRFTLVLETLAAVTRLGEAAALVDLGDGFDPQDGAAAGIDLERLLWVRPRHLKEALASAEMILGSSLPLLVVDLGLPPLRGGRGAEAAWLRLARSAKSHRVALLVASPYRVSGTAANRVLQVRRRRPAWTGHGAMPSLLQGLAAQLEMVKGPSRGSQPHNEVPEPLAFRLAEALAPLPVLPPLRPTGATATASASRRASA